MLERRFSRVLREYFPNYIEINMVEDFNGPGLLQNVKSTEDFYMRVSMSTTTVQRER